jgi:hypothetical protein
MADPGAGHGEGAQRDVLRDGQGTALSADAHHGTDQVTMEARAYGLARRYAPFLVNSVVGFIGPEYLATASRSPAPASKTTSWASSAASRWAATPATPTTPSADQNDVENLEMLLAAAGVNYLMGIPAGDDVMLNYETTSFHNNAALREIFGLRPAPEFEAWLERMGLWRNGKPDRPRRRRVGVRPGVRTMTEDELRALVRRGGDARWSGASAPAAGPGAPRVRAARCGGGPHHRPLPAPRAPRRWSRSRRSRPRASPPGAPAPATSPKSTSGCGPITPSHSTRWSRGA